MYLLPDINLRLRPRLLTELRPGTRILSHNFDLGDWRPDAEEELDASRIYLWIVPAVAGGSWSMRLADGTVLALEFEQHFQELSGTLGSVVLRDVALRGTKLRFTAETPAGVQTFRGIVGDATIEADPGAPPDAVGGWTARRTD